MSHACHDDTRESCFDYIIPSRRALGRSRCPSTNKKKDSTHTCKISFVSVTRRTGNMPRDPVPAPTAIAHIGLRTRNPDKLVSFYQILLGARVVLTNDFISVLTWDEEHHRLAIIHDDTAVPKQTKASGVDHIALKFASAKDLVQVYRHAKEAAITPNFCLNHGVTTSLYYTDPDGNNIEAHIEAYSDPDDVERHMKAIDPTKIKAVRFDPEDLLRRVEAGEDDESLKRAGLLGPQPALIGTSTAEVAAGG